jgi:hypothetical protein
MDLFSNKGRVLYINTTTTVIGGSSNSIWNEEPGGIRDGTNKIFTTISDFQPNSTRIYRNGIRMKLGLSNDYTETGTNEITFNYTIRATDNLIIDYDLVAAP